MSRDSVNIVFEWNGEALVPLPRHHNLANAEFTVGERYRCEVQDDRTWVSHKHQFAWLHEAWLSLPEHIAERFLNEDHLRRHALIAGGFCDSSTVVCASRAEAERWYKHLREREPDTVIVLKGNVLVQFTAWSQSRRAMDKATFQRSKDAVLSYVSDLLDQKAQAA